MELRSKTFTSVSKHDYYSRKMSKFAIRTYILSVNGLIDKDKITKRMAISVKWMSYQSKYFWIYVDTCESLIEKNNILTCFGIMYRKTFDLQEELNEYYEISYHSKKNLIKKCLTYRSLYEKKFEPIFLDKIPLDLLRHILLFV